MKFAAKFTNLGIELSLHSGDGPEPLKPAADAETESTLNGFVPLDAVSPCGGGYPP